LIVIFAPTWEWIVAANLLLGVNQGLCWSTTVIMKIDLSGPHQRGLAMGVNEAAGYVAVAVAALASGYLAASYGLRPAPFLLGIVFAVVGLAVSLMLVNETRGHARHEAKRTDGALERAAPSFRTIFRLSSWGDRALLSTSQAGLVNNLNDGLVWGLFPIYFASQGASLKEIGWLAAIYPGVWGISQLGTGVLSDRMGRKPSIVAGMVVQAVGLLVVLSTRQLSLWVAGAVLLGLGTALVYPTLLAAVGDVAHPDWRGSAVGVYRLWRDAGYVLGALTAGILADLFGEGWAIGVVAALTFLSGIGVAVFMYETRGAPRIEIATPVALLPAWDART
jgi:MFS family permease